MIADYSDRRFQLWEYKVSHGSLLIRSPKSSETVRNVDLVFVGVEYLAVPRVLDGVVVDKGTEEDHAAVSAEFDRVDPERLFVLVSADRRYPIVAVACRAAENDGEIFDSPF